MNFNDKEYWRKYYKKNYSPYKESDFAKFVLQFLEKEKYLLELGCGNGRDSIFFSKNLINVLAVDQVSDEINFLNSNFSNERIKFICDDFTNLEVLDNFDYIYSRFTIHSITESEEDRVLKWVFKHLYKNGLFFIESRSINDIMYNNGTKLSINENFTDHYRRYMNKDKFISKLEYIGFKIRYSIEDKGLAVSEKEDPSIVRIIAEK